MLRLSEILKATNGFASHNEKDIIFRNISTDSRKIKKGGLFIALKGPKFDGHDHVNYALQHGALGAVVSKTIENLPKDKIVIHVGDTLRALQDIAAYYRNKFKIKIVGITGSAGKTTTKDMVASVLSKNAPAIKTKENLNNEIGVPLTIFQIKKKNKYAAIEMGMRGKGEIGLLSKIIKPDIAVITNIGEAHIQRLKTRNAIAAAKGEILEYLPEKGTAVLNHDDKYFAFLKKICGAKKIISFGLKKGADVKAENIKEYSDKTIFDMRYKKKRAKIKAPLPGRHNVYNALCAAAAGLSLNIPIKKIKQGIQVFKPSSKRMEISTTKNGIRIINDTYNANPSSMKAAISVLASQNSVVGSKTPRRIAVIGDMLELGKIAKSAHEDIGRYISDSGIEIVFAVGDLAKYYCKGTKFCAPTGNNQCFYFKNNAEAAKKLKKTLKPNDVILFKASRAMKLEEISEKILDNYI